MAEHNLVHIYGRATEPPRITKNDETGEYERAILWIDTLRSSRPYRDRNEADDLRHDMLMCVSSDPSVIRKMDGIQKNDIIFMRATLNTRNVKKTVICSRCGEKYAINSTSETAQTDSSMMTFLSPICFDVRARGLSDEASMQLMTEFREMSNECTVIGNLCGEVKRAEKGHAASYQIGIDRKFYLVGDDPAVRADYPYVRAYGQQAEKDYRHLKKGSLVLIDGWIQLRRFNRKTKCPACGEPTEVDNFVFEVVPYATEYLQNYITQEEYEAEQERKAAEAEAQVFGPAAAAAQAPGPQDGAGIQDGAEAWGAAGQGGEW